MVLLAGLATYLKKYFGHNNVRKCNRTGCSDARRRPGDTSLKSIRNDIRTKTEDNKSNVEGHDVFKTGSKNYSSNEGYEMNTTTVKINAQDLSAASLVAMIKDLERTVKNQHDETNEKFADLDTKLLKIPNDMEKDGNAKRYLQ